MVFHGCTFLVGAAFELGDEVWGTTLSNMKKDGGLMMDVDRSK